MSLIDQIVARAKSNRQRIVLPESFEERTITAADRAIADGLADIILIGNREKVLAYAAQLGLSRTLTRRPSSTRRPARRPKNTPSSSSSSARRRA